MSLPCTTVMVVLGIVTEVMVLPGFTEHACCQIDRRWSNVPRFATEALFRLRRMHGYAYCFFFMPTVAALCVVGAQSFSCFVRGMQHGI